jgi:hypothetical protein
VRSPNYLDRVILKGGAAVLQQAGLVPLSNDAGEVETVREGLTWVIALDYVRSGGTSNPILSGVINTCPHRRGLWRKQGADRASCRVAILACLRCRTRGSVPAVFESDN